MKDKDYTPYLVLAPSDFRRLQWRKGWALSTIGLILYCILRIFGQKPKDYMGICPYFEIGHGWGGFAMGWFFVCSKSTGESTKMHEVGHGIQNAAVGGLTMVGYSLGSAARYWWRRIFGKKTDYDSWFFEGDATRLGTLYVTTIREQGGKG